MRMQIYSIFVSNRLRINIIDSIFLPISWFLPWQGTVIRAIWREYRQNDVQVERIILGPTFINVDIFSHAIFLPLGKHILSQGLLSHVSGHLARAYIRDRCCTLYLNSVNNPVGRYALCRTASTIIHGSSLSIPSSVIRLEFPSIMFLQRDPDSLNTIPRRIIKVSRAIHV